MNKASSKKAGVEKSLSKNPSDQLGESEARVHRALEIETVGVVFFGNDGQIIDSNETFLRLSGYDREDIEKGLLRLDQLTPPEFSEQSRKAFDEFLASGCSTPYEKQYVCKDGSRRWGLFSTKRISEEEGAKFIVDITDKKLAEEALRKSEERYSTLFNSIDEGFCTFEILFDEKGKPVDYLFLEVNPAFERLTGLRDPVGKTALELVPGLEPFWVETYGKVALTGKPIRFENRSVPMKRWFDVFATRIGGEGSRKVALAFTDITERKLSEEKLRLSEERLRLLIESVEDYAIITLTPENRIHTWNTGAERIFGYTEDEILGESGEIIFTPEDRREGAPEWEVKTAVETGRASDERWHLRKDGSRFFASGVLTVLGDNAKNGFVKILRDLTERKQFEDALREADRRKDEFLAILAHELRNPLAPIRIALEIMRRGESRQKGLEAREIISRQTEQIVDLVDDLLDISRITQGKIKLRKKRLDLREALKSALEAAQPMIDTSEHRLTVFTPDEPIFVEGDFTRLSQIFTNILANAAKYTKPGGNISLTAERENGNAIVRIRDTGLGIPKEMLPHIFDMFMQVHHGDRRSQGGMGIGLSLVRRLVEMHGGTVSAFSEGANKGSEFVVKLPAAEKQTPATKRKAKTAEKETPESASAKQMRILVVDDNADAAQVLSFALELEGHIVRVAHDGKGGIRTAEDFQPQVCLLDIGLPDIDGFKVARQIREKLPDAMLVAVTGWGQDEDRQRSQRAGFDHHLIKPVAIEDITDLLADK